jgi:uncharacterized protein involved in exopolysaccharide biosynthesis
MSTDNQLQNLLNQIHSSLKKHLWLWVAPTILFGVLGTTYAAFKSSTWKSWQVIHVRDDGNATGRFGDTDSRKAAQETVIEMSRNRSVIEAALRDMGPPKSLFRIKEWPTSGDVNGVRDAVSISAPPGTELGNADVIHLTVKSKSKEHALELNRAVCNQLDIHLQQLRMSKAEGLVTELKNKQALAKKELQSATSELKKMEREIGKDLGELRTLDQTGSGESNLRTSLTQITNDMRASKNRRMEQQQLGEILERATADATKLVSIPDRLLDSQPELRRLKDGLAGSQLKIAELQGTMSETHPAVRAAERELNEIRAQISNRLPALTESVRADIQVITEQVNSLQRELLQVQNRLAELASLRAPYSNLVNMVQNRRDQLTEVNQSLSRAQAIFTSATMSSVFTRVGETEVGDSPIGPGRSTIAMASWIGGLMIGIGLVMLASPIEQIRNDGLRAFGRRTADKIQANGRRTGDREKSEVASDGAAERRSGDRRNS